MSACNITRRDRGDVTILDISGRITLGEGVGTLRQTIAELVSQSREKIVLNLAKTSYLDSSGICEAASSFMKIGRMGGKLKLLAMGERVRDDFQITKLYTVFEVFENEDDAVRSFEGDYKVASMFNSRDG